MTAIVSEGILAGVDDGAGGRYFTTPTYASSGVFGHTDYGVLYRSQYNVRLVVDFLARNVGQVGLHFFRRLSDTDRARLIGEPLSALFDTPNPATTPYRLMSSLVADLGIWGMAAWVKLGGAARARTGPPAGLARVEPWRVTVLGANHERPLGFVISGPDGATVALPPERIVYFRFYNPDHASIGLSPLESLRRLLLEEAAASDYRARYWANGAKVSGFIERPRDAPRWSSDARDRFMADWRARYTGEGNEVGGTPVLEDGMAYKPGAFSARDSQYLEARKLTREEVAAAYFIPPPMVGILDNANYSNVKQFHAQLYQDTLGPWFELIAQEVELQLIPDFYPGAGSGVYAEFNIAEKLKGSFEEQAAALSLAVGGPWMTRAEARGRANLPELDDPAAGELITPMNVSVGGQAAPNAPQPDDGSGLPPTGAASAGSALQAQVVARTVERLLGVMSAESVVRKGSRVLADAVADLAELNGGAA